jgi:hypothetical protein
MKATIGMYRARFQYKLANSLSFSQITNQITKVANTSGIALLTIRIHTKF